MSIEENSVLIRDFISEWQIKDVNIIISLSGKNNLDTYGGDGLRRAVIHNISQKLFLLLHMCNICHSLRFINYQSCRKGKPI